MTHGMTERDGSFTVREPAWHGFSTVLADYPTRDQAKRIAHPWEPVTEEVYRKVYKVDENGNDLVETYELIEGHQAVVRDDDDTVLGVTSSTLEVVSNNQMYDIAEAIEGEADGQVMYETGGSLYGGKKVWLLLRLRDPIVIKGDNGPTIPYYALQNAHDGSGSFRGQAPMTKIVCDNTARAADIEASLSGMEFVFRHTKNIATRIEEAKAALAGWRESVQTYRLACEALNGMWVQPDGREEFVQRFIPEPPPHMVSDRVLANIEDGRATLRQILAGPTCDRINETAYGLVQAAIEYNQHYRRARSGESRFKRAYLDPSRVTTDAVQIARLVAV